MSTLFWIGVGVVAIAFVGILVLAKYKGAGRQEGLNGLFAVMNLGFMLTATQVTTVFWLKLFIVAAFAAVAVRSLYLAATAHTGASTRS